MAAQPREACYWREQTDPPPPLAAQPPARVEVAVIGAGYTGLSAALTTARGGRDTLVLEAQEPGHGCSTRNGGQIGTSVKPSLERLARRFGAERARAIRAEGKAALAWVGDFIEAEGIACDFRRVGRFHAAHTPRHYEELVRDAERLRREEGIESHAVPRDAQRSELGSDAYFGGVVFPRHCALHPGRFHAGLLRRALAAGVQLVPRCPVLRIERREGAGTRFRLHTPLGVTEASDVIVATNGYTTALLPWLRRRVIPIASSIIATEPLPGAVIDRLFPRDRVVSDTRRVVYYYRASPDRRRVLFGGRVAASEVAPRVAAERLRQEMCRIFPELEGVGITHVWSGSVGYSFDSLAHVGVTEGVHFALAYCGSGVGMAPYLGMRVGQKVLGLGEGATAFDGLPFPTRPFYRGWPWFLPAAVAWYRWCDARALRRAARAR